MTESRKKKPEAEGFPLGPPPPDPADAATGERTTLVPGFDLSELAREMFSPDDPDAAPEHPPGPRTPPPPTLPSGRMRAEKQAARFEDAPEPTTREDAELTAAKARAAALLSELPPPMPTAAALRPGSMPPHRSPSGALLSLVNARGERRPSTPPEKPNEAGGALNLVARQSRPPSGAAGRPGDPVVEMRDRFALGDFTGALEAAEALVVEQPGNAEARAMVERCRTTLTRMFQARIGPLTRVPQVIVPPHQLRWLCIDHRAGFVLSLVDGMSSVEMILDLSGMPQFDTLRIVYELFQQRIIAFQ